MFSEKIKRRVSGRIIVPAAAEVGFEAIIGPLPILPFPPPTLPSSIESPPRAPFYLVTFPDVVIKTLTPERSAPWVTKTFLGYDCHTCPFIINSQQKSAKRFLHGSFRILHYSRYVTAALSLMIRIPLPLP